MIAWKVGFDGRLPFTFITDQCKTVEEVEAAMFEKFCRYPVSVARL